MLLPPAKGRTCGKDRHRTAKKTKFEEQIFLASGASMIGAPRAWRRNAADAQFDLH
jgi:hypothetical protein